MGSEMKIDYYKILGVNRDASSGTIRTAYKQLARKWHPDKNLNNIAEADAMFKRISDAHEVLIDDDKRKEYDHNCNNSNNNNNKSFSFSKATWYRESSSGSAEQSSCQCSHSAGLFGSMEPTSKEPPLKYRLVCTLEELYSGCVKHIKITESVLVSGQKTEVTEIVKIVILCGTKKGTEYTLKREGTISVVIVTIDEEPHDVYKRDGNDLIISETFSLWEVLTCSCTVDLTTLEGRKLIIPINCASLRFHEKIIPSEGMPLHRVPFKQGNLRIKFKFKIF